MRLIAENLGGERGGRLVFSGLAFAVEQGRALTVTGQNGAGKSTLLRIVAGLLPASSGSVGLKGGDERFPTLASAAHYLGHLNAMKPSLRLAENLAFWRDFAGEPALTVGEALERVGLRAIGHLPFGYLSTGQRRRAALARLLVNRRPVWLLDEPTAGLDGASEADFSAIANTHLDQGGIIVAATHQPLGLTGAAELRMGDE